ncbi:MAG: signal peptide peptidase SppA [Ignavibacteriae bacterium]|nr:signal peptide peptidase SppA [Ignavibacteriota bacterium]
MKRTLTVLSLLLVTSFITSAQTSFPSYYQDFQLTSPGAMKLGLYGYDNPASISFAHQPDVYFTWSDNGVDWNDFNRWGLFTAFNPLGFGFIHQKLPDGYVNDFRLSLAGGSPAFSTGISIGWSRGETRFVERSTHVSLGVISRPNAYLSIGAVGTTSFRERENEVSLDLAFRPLGNEAIALFGDYALRGDQSLKNGGWSAGVATEFLPGVRITGRYFETQAFTVGVQFSFGNAGLTTQEHYDKDGKYQYSTYGVRLGAYDRTVLSKLSEKQKYLELNMIGGMKYQRFKFFDNSKTLIEMLESIDAAKTDPAVSGIAMNLSGMNINREMLWELRQELVEFKSTGKHVVVFIDRLGIDSYHFASVADKIVMDSQGTLILEGFVMGRTFVKGTLEKLGIGYDEWRFFEFKSANESLSRDKMSDADRLQRQALIDENYRIARNDICAARGFTHEQFDNMVNNETIYLAQEALAKGLVDTLGRWETVKEVIKQLEGEEKSYTGRGTLAKFNLPPDDRWGSKPTIALIYAIGSCAMDEGIKARTLVKYVEAAVNSPNVRAIVLRVDSPGGDGMASDYIAEALKKAKGKKPVIVSQGYVAASGGYWLSMYADTIIAAPNTITGSIGVIGGWIYDNGLKEKLGFSTDLVKAGEHADLGFGFALPFIGAGLPDRNLTEAERAKAEHLIKSHYTDFVGKVAEGRGMSTDAIHKIAQGRVWTGTDGLNNGLIDGLGGLETAIFVARHRAGIPADEQIEIIEMPEPGWFNTSSFIPKFFGVEAPQPDPLVEYVKFRLLNNGMPMPMLPMEYMEFPWNGELQ